eukprot:7385979-Prymnesium_polylepis.3
MSHPGMDISASMEQLTGFVGRQHHKMVQWRAPIGRDHHERGDVVVTEMAGDLPRGEARAGP